MNSIKIANNYIRLALLLFFLSASYGWLMRLSTIVNIAGFDYTRFLQSHSHVTFLGWGFIGVTTLFNFLFVKKQNQFNRSFKTIFGIEIICIFLMLLSFPLQGYKVFSIVLLSIFLITSYIYIHQFLKHFNSKATSPPILLFIKSSLFFYILSSIGIWAIGIVVATQGKTDLYYNSIYFYLHFLYNGFFVFALFGLFFQYLKQQNLNLNSKHLNQFFWITFTTCIPAYILSLVNSQNAFTITINLITALIQLISIPYLILILNSVKKRFIDSLSRSEKFLLSFVILAYIFKLILQFTSAFPQLSEHIIILKSYFVIGYIHLVTLGFLSPFLLFSLIQFKFLNTHKIGILLFLSGVVLTETILFTQGHLIWFFKSSLPYYSELLFGASTILWIGILSFLNFKRVNSAL